MWAIPFIWGHRQLIVSSGWFAEEPVLKGGCVCMCESGESKWLCLLCWQGCSVLALAGCSWLYLSVTLRKDWSYAMQESTRWIPCKSKLHHSGGLKLRQKDSHVHVRVGCSNTEEGEVSMCTRLVQIMSTITDWTGLERRKLLYSLLLACVQVVLFTQALRYLPFHFCESVGL